MNQDNSEGDSLIAVLEELTDLVTRARAVPMSASAMVNRSEVLDLLQAARDLVPDQIVRADGLLANADSVTTQAQSRASEIIERAKQDAEDTVSEARDQASRLVSQDAVTIAAKARAQRIIDDSKSQAEKLRQGADTYSDSTLLALQGKVSDIGGEIDSLTSSLQDRIDVMLSQIIAGRNVIAERYEGGDATTHESGVEGENEEESWI